MIFESQARRVMWWGVACSWLFDALLAGVITYVLDFGWEGFFIGFLIIQAVLFAAWVRRSLWAWIWFAMRKAQQTDALQARFFGIGYPTPAYQAVLGNPMEYFQSVAADSEQPTRVRMAAMADASALKHVGEFGGLQALIRVTMMFEEALVRLGRAELEKLSSVRREASSDEA